MTAKRGVFFCLGVNLGSDVVALATSQAQVFVQNMPKGSIRAIGIGNEPDFYPTVSRHRPSTYDYADYAQDFLTWRTSIFAAILDSPLVMGPSDAEFPSLPLSSNGMDSTSTATTGTASINGTPTPRFTSTCLKLNLLPLILTIQRQMAFRLPPPCPSARKSIYQHVPGERNPIVVSWLL